MCLHQVEILQRERVKVNYRTLLKREIATNVEKIFDEEVLKKDGFGGAGVAKVFYRSLNLNICLP
ncbi:MAG: hypothetical protein UW68_C0017G0024 [Candidatus Collierbacteria bacterium GW2011_GWB1_44_6]|uniref:Uncharacterized protein n=2 Tax=Candidatus Collieribacteriota TaxID=1752725 RepID=A0A0G1MM77_9BACT|nr:MAG: hypothetical protein UV68_C0016G0006 [Candidatus Collierbacteria bacterium GW2011_GWC2_43_12]KKT73089.1 MAG: hypothetical protein UW68_C0017G0024 [Candidatus Collierbacteria bacterium GW2011_GWB1_44_6]